MRVIYIAIGLLIAISTGADAAKVEHIKITNLGFSRTLSYVNNIIKTTEIVVAGSEMLAQPSVEFMIDLDYKDEAITLVPSDFNIKGANTVTKDREICTSIELNCRRSDLPLRMYIDYFREERGSFQQKSIVILPCNKAKDAVLKRITIESIRIKNTAVPIAPDGLEFVNETKSSFALIDPKTNRGLCWDLPSKTITPGRNQSLTVYETVDVPVEKGYQTARFTLGAVSGKPEEMFAAYRRMLMDTRFPALARDSKLAALQKRFANYFAVCRNLPYDNSAGIDMEARAVDGKGFIFIFNPSDADAKVKLPLTDPLFASSGQIALSDWTNMESGAKIDAASPAGVEIELPANGYKIIGVNIDG